MKNVKRCLTFKISFNEVFERAKEIEKITNSMLLYMDTDFALLKMKTKHYRKMFTFHYLSTMYINTTVLRGKKQE